MFGNLFDIVGSAVKIVAAPISVTIDIADAALKPVAEVTKEISSVAKTLAKDIKDSINSPY